MNVIRGTICKRPASWAPKFAVHLPSYLLHRDDQRQTSTQSSSLGTLNIRLLSTMNPNDNHGNQTNVSQNINMTTHQKAKLLFSKYGPIFVGTYLGVYATTLLSLFSSLEYGLIDVNMISVYTNILKETLPFPHPMISDGLSDGVSVKIWDILEDYFPSSVKIRENEHLSNLIIAWIAVKFTEPIRLAVSVVLCPRVVKMLGQEDDDLRPSV